MRTVCYLISTLAVSGPVNQLYDLVAALDRTEYDPVVLTLSPEPDESALPRFRDLGVDLYSLGLSRREGVTRGRSRLRRAVGALDPDVVHSHGLRADLLSAAALGSRTRVSTIHNYPYHDYPRRYGRAIGYPAAWSHVRGLSRIEYPVACSESVRHARALRGVSPLAIRNGVDAERYAPAGDAERAEKRRELGLPADADVFLSIGPLLSRKDPVTVVRGFLRSDASADAYLVQVSDGPLFDRCRRIAGGSDRVLLPGRVPRVEPYLRAADYFVSASRAEGLPLAVLEALASGLPVCLSDIPPHEEILELGPESGCAFAAGSAAALAAGIDRLRADDGSRSTAARRTAVEKLSADRMSEEYRRLYDRIVPAARR